MNRDTPNAEKGILWLKLSEDSKNLLLSRFPPKYANRFCDHITLAYSVERIDFSELIGKHVDVKVYSYASNEKVEAIQADINGLPDSYGVPHITLSTQKGVKPFESVSMLKGEHEVLPIDPQLTISGRIEFIVM